MLGGFAITVLELGGEKFYREEEGDSGKEDEGHSDSRFAIDFGHEVGGGNVDGDSGGERQSDFYPPGQQADDQHSEDGGESEHDGGDQRRAAAASRSHHDGGDCEAFRHFVQEDGDEDEPSKHVGNHEAGAYGDSVKERVSGQAGENGVAGVGGDE